MTLSDDKKAFIGKWKLYSSEGFDDYMKAIGISYMTRMMGNTVKPNLDIKVAGDHWTIDTTSAFKNTHTEFDLGKEFEEFTPDGRTMKSVCNFKDGKLVQEQTKIKPEDHNSTFTRYVTPEGKLVVECHSEGVIAKRVYEKTT